ncbi:neuropeptide Y receptor type 1-like [Agrilus planipennis]|uniref:Neuropeptide Y receptor type 1-like n=1 Tax=Agrilus planipennis TaxID=224129 RepID=A0A1W4X425_AGRPL|nr:neuropeptide Y receptor type 1-like [Agrilus planipennis]
MISIPASEETVASGFNSTSIIEISLNSSFNYSYAPFLEENGTANSSKDMFSNLTESSNSVVFPAYIRITSMIFCVIIMCLGVIGNIMVPVVIFKTKDMRNSTNIFLVNLSIADLMVLLVCTPTVLVEVNSKPETWVLGEEMCK